MFDKNNLIFISSISLFISFIISLAILYLAKPKWIQVIDENSGKLVIYWPSTLAYSVTFAFVCAIIVLLLVTSYNKPTDKPFSYDVPINLTSSDIALSYCGAKHST